MCYNLIGGKMKNNVDDQKLILKGFYGLNNGSSEDYNYDLMPLINDNFNFFDFIKNGRDTSLTENGAFLVITNNQYVLGYNRGFGTGGHDIAFARAFSLINDGVLKYDNSRNVKFIPNGELDYYNSSLNGRTCEKNYLTARIFYEYVCDNALGTPVFSGEIFFSLDAHDFKITPLQYEMFEQFYNDYNDEIILATKSIPHFTVGYRYRDANGSIKEMQTRNLDSLREYLKNNIDYERHVDDDKNIIGVEKKVGKLK